MNQKTGFMEKKHTHKKNKKLANFYQNRQRKKRQDTNHQYHK